MLSGGGSTIFQGLKKPATTTFAYLFIDKTIGIISYQGNVISQMRMIDSIHPVE